MVNLIPFRFEGREGLGFLASVNLGIDTGTTFALRVVGGRLVRHDENPPFWEIILSVRLASGELMGQQGQGLNILDNTGLFAMVLTAILALHEDNHHG